MRGGGGGGGDGGRCVVGQAVRTVVGVAMYDVARNLSNRRVQSVTKGFVYNKNRSQYLQSESAFCQTRTSSCFGHTLFPFPAAVNRPSFVSQIRHPERRGAFDSQLGSVVADGDDIPRAGCATLCARRNTRGTLYQAGE